MNWQDYAGRIVLVDGLTCKISVKEYAVRYPVAGTRQVVEACPTVRARHSREYAKMRRYLGDDFTFSISDGSPEMLCDIITQLG